MDAELDAEFGRVVELGETPEGLEALDGLNTKMRAKALEIGRPDIVELCDENAREIAIVRGVGK